jgi:hypothetical protein
VDSGLLSPEVGYKSADGLTANSLELIRARNYLCYSVDVTAFFLNVSGLITYGAQNLKANSPEVFTFGAESS